MTELKCPVCNVGYVHESVEHWCCDNEFCPSYDETSPETYDVLINTKKKLDIAKSKLNGIHRLYSHAFCNREDWLQVCMEMVDKANTALEQINQKEEK